MVMAVAVLGKEGSLPETGDEWSCPPCTCTGGAHHIDVERHGRQSSPYAIRKKASSYTDADLERTKMVLLSPSSWEINFCGIKGIRMKGMALVVDTQHNIVPSMAHSALHLWLGK